MGNAVPIVIFTLFWILVGAGLPWVVPRGPNRGIMQTMLVTTAICCYMFWLLAFLHQLNPLIGPELKNTTLLYVANEWGTVS